MNTEMNKLMTTQGSRTDWETFKLLFPQEEQEIARKRWGLMQQDLKETTNSLKLENALGASSFRQIGGEHYKKQKIQVWDYIIANDLDYFQGSIIKYVTRWKDKGWIEDLQKARHFLDKYIETMEVKHKELKERPEK